MAVMVPLPGRSPRATPEAVRSGNTRRPRRSPGAAQRPTGKPPRATRRSRRRTAGPRPRRLRPAHQCRRLLRQARAAAGAVTRHNGRSAVFLAATLIRSRHQAGRRKADRVLDFVLVVDLRAALDLGADDRAELSCVGSIVGATPIEMLRLRVVRSRRAIDDAAGIDPADDAMSAFIAFLLQPREWLIRQSMRRAP